MIRLGLRLTLDSGKEAMVRLIVTAAAVALGVGVLLCTFAIVNAVNAQNDRYAWLESGAPGIPGPASAGRMWWLLTTDEFRGQLIGRVDVAPAGPGAPVPPGIPHLPGPGQFYASPALSRLLHAVPASELAARYQARQVGVIGAAALPSPQSLAIVIGRTARQISRLPGARLIDRIDTTPPSSCNGPCADIGIDANGIDLILSVVTAALLFPVLLFIGTASRLAAARREQRFAAMRLVGATPRQISVIAEIESVVAAVAGTAAGFALFFAVLPLLAKVPFTGARFFPADLSLNLADIGVAAIGVPIAAAVAARLALRRVQLSPLGVSRRVSQRPPRAWRIVPLLAGLAELLFFVFAGRPGRTVSQIGAYLPGLLVTMAGLVIAGPWITAAGARVMSRTARHPAQLIAGRRLADNPKAGFRAISGLVLALFVATTAIVVITTINASQGRGPSSPAASDTLVDMFTDFSYGSGSVISVPALRAGLLGELRSIPGVRGVTVVHTDPGTRRINTAPSGLIACAQLARTPALGRCRAGAATAVFTPDIGGPQAFQLTQVWSSSRLPAAALARLPVQILAIATNGSAAAIEQARTDLELAYPYRYQPATISEFRSRNPTNARNAQYQQLADVVILASLLIAGCSLAVSVTAGISERKRPFSLLRLSGTPLRTLRQVIALESALPLIGVAAMSIGAGFAAATMFMRSQYNEPPQLPDGQYYLMVAAGLVVSLAIIAATFPLLARITGPETARNE